MSKKIIRLKEVEQKTGFKKSKIYDEIALGKFPAQVALGRYAVGWLEHEVDAWIDSLARKTLDRKSRQRRQRDETPGNGRARR